jgi:titin
MPNEPTNFVWVASNATSGVLSWTAPSDKGSPALRDYVVQYSTDGRQTWKTIDDGYSTTPSLPISNMKDNTDYTFRVRGENGGGIDDYTSQYMDLAWAYLELHTDAAVAPNAPTDLVVSNVSKSGFQLKWTKPANDGGANITDFTVELSRNNGASWVAAKADASTSQQLTVSGAAPGTTYLVRVSAVNKVGASEYLTGSATTLVSNASKPLNLRLTSQSNGRASVNWDLPGTNGGAAITDYKVEVTSGTTWTPVAHNASNTLGFTLTGLAKGKTYKVRVSAVTSIGLGEVSDILTFAADTTAPGSPTGLTVGSITKSSVALTWVTPADTGGLSVSDYVVELSADNGYSWSSVTHNASNSVKMTLSRLAGATTYMVLVSAKNSTGVGEAAYATFTTLAGSPSAPRSLTATASESGATLTWQAPLNDNGATLSDYKIEASSDGGSKWTTINHAAFVGEGFAVTGLKQAPHTSSA